MKLTKKQKTQMANVLADEYKQVQKQVKHCIFEIKLAQRGVFKTKQSHYVDDYFVPVQDANKCLYLARKHKHILESIDTALLCDQVVEWLKMAKTNRQRIVDSISDVVDNQLKILSQFSEDRVFDGDLSDTNRLFQTPQIEEAQWRISELNLLDELLEKIEKIVA